MNAPGTPRATRAWIGWPLERVLFALAGTVVLLSATLRRTFHLQRSEVRR